MGLSLTLSGRTLAGQELTAKLRRIQGALALAGVEPGDVLAFVASIEQPTLLLTLALLDARIPFLPLHPRASAAEQAELCARVGARWVSPAEADHPPQAWLASFGRSPEATAALVATSGSSGEPKLCVLSHGALRASARASAENLGFLPGDRWLLCLPFAHVGGLSILTRCLFAGRGLVAHPGFEPQAVLELIEHQAVSLVSAVPSMLGPLFDADQRGVLRRLRALLVGGALCPVDLRREAERRAIPLVTTYGLTEACSQVATQRPGALHDPESLDSGHPLPGAEVRIRGGCIEVRGPMLASGYFGEAPWPAGHFFRTSDLGELDAEGRLIVHGRADDVVITGGENVHPSSVERVLSAQPGVRDALVFGVPDARLGQVVAALLVLEPGVSVNAVLTGASPALAGFARPRRVACVAALPTTAVGKPDRRRAAREPLSPC
ncbi:MAG: AMP-binding protein [Polyangiaceae bacterium]|nr:AMP-binding protein [Polyangiaceae bacterium]